MKISYSWEAAGLTDVGMKREINEDSIFLDAGLGLLILADGMGGHASGEVASAMAVASIQDALGLVDGARPDWTETGGEQLQEKIDTATVAANAAIHSAAGMDARYQGMGTTVVLAICNGKSLVYGHVGDSRLYRLRKGSLKQLTRDHSLISDLVEKGFYTEEEAKSATQKNVITRALGNEDTVKVDTAQTSLKKGDIYLLCSDGLTDLVDDEEIAEIIENRSSLDAACKALVDSANASGGKDNVSVILLAVDAAVEGTGLLAKSMNWFLR